MYARGPQSGTAGAGSARLLAPCPSDEEDFVVVLHSVDDPEPQKAACNTQTHRHRQSDEQRCSDRLRLVWSARLRFLTEEMCSICLPRLRLDQSESSVGVRLSILCSTHTSHTPQGTRDDHEATALLCSALCPLLCLCSARVFALRRLTSIRLRAMVIMLVVMSALCVCMRRRCSLRWLGGRGEAASEHRSGGGRARNSSEGRASGSGRQRGAGNAAEEARHREQEEGEMARCLKTGERRNASLGIREGRILAKDKAKRQQI